MNERIRELLKHAEERYPRHLAVAVPEVVLRQDALEKFAELIVKECMMICGAIQGAGEVMDKSDFASGAAQCRAIIKRDFGVEE